MNDAIADCNAPPSNAPLSAVIHHHWSFFKKEGRHAF